MRRIVRWLCIAIFCSISTHAYAGAWTQDQGSGQAILSTSYYGTDSYWDNKGDRHSQPTYSKDELDPYLEYGLRDGTTVGANLSLQRAHQNGATASASQVSWGVGDSEFFLRQRLWQQNGFVVSAEPMIKLPSPENSSTQPRLGGSSPDAGLGLSAGYGFDAYGYSDFADVDTQYRHRFGTPKDQVNIAGTLGIGFAPQWMIMPQAFLTYRTDSTAVAAFTNSSGDDYNLVKLQLSAVYKATNDISLQFGGFEDVAGKNSGGGGGALFAIWKKF